MSDLRHYKLGRLVLAWRTSSAGDGLWECDGKIRRLYITKEGTAFDMPGCIIILGSLAIHVGWLAEDE